MRSQKSNITNGEPYTWRQVSTVRGRAFGNRPPQGGYGAESLSLPEYQINPVKSVYVSTGGTPTKGQIKGMLEETRQASHYLGFDKDEAGRGFVKNFKVIAKEMGFADFTVQAFHPLGQYKDWNDALLGKKDQRLIDQGEIDFDYSKFAKEQEAERLQQEQERKQQEREERTSGFRR